MSKIGYNYRSRNLNKATAATTGIVLRHDTRKVLLMQLNDTTRPEFLPISSRAIDRTGERYNRLVVLGFVGRTRTGILLWLCQCDCGNTSTVQMVNLRSGGTKSCGCHIKEVTSKRSKTHGMRFTRLYRIWAGILTRCFNPNEPGYRKYYGSRGITICDSWRKSFESFRDHVSQLPNYGEDGYTLDRIDNDGNYEPGNVRWATDSEQRRNKRDNHMITFDGRTQCVTAWAEELGLKPELVFGRLKLGWTTERALTQKPRRSLRPRLIEQRPVPPALVVREED